MTHKQTLAERVPAQTLVCILGNCKNILYFAFTLQKSCNHAVSQYRSSLTHLSFVLHTTDQSYLNLSNLKTFRVSGILAC